MNDELEALLKESACMFIEEEHIESKKYPKFTN